MSYYDNSGDSSWKHQANNDTVGFDAANSNYMNNDSNAPSPNNFNSTNNYNGGENGGFHHGEFGSGGIGIGSSNTYFNNGQQQQLMENTVNDNTNITAVAAAANPIEEESQVVPISLDHLSRDELCRMIYRLDYERNTLKDQLEIVRNQQLNSTKLITGILDGSKKKGKKRSRGNGAGDSGALKNNKLTRQQQDQQLIAVRGGKENPGVGAEEEELAIVLAPAHHPPSPPLPPSPLEIENVQKRLGVNILATIKSKAIHGGRKVPKSTTTLTDVSLSMVLAIMQNYNDKKISETKRMIKWNLLDDRDIATILKSERLIHPVKDDGTGHILPSGSMPRNIYYWAKFVGMKMQYDKRELALTCVVKTTAAGSGRPENVPERVRYSRGEMEGVEDFNVEEEGGSGLFG